MSVISIINSKGGVGKTSSTLEIASCLGLTGERVLVVDLDGQADCTKVLSKGKRPSNGIYDALIGEEEIGSLAHRSGFENVYYIAADRRLGGFEAAIANRLEREMILSEVIEPVRKMFKYIVFDCPPDMNMLTTNALVASDFYICPCDLSRFSNEAISAIKHHADLIRKRLNPKLKCLGTFLVRVEKMNSFASRLGMEGLKKLVGDDLFDISIPATSKIPEAHLKNSTLTHMFPDNKVAIAYRQITQNIIERS